MIELKPCPFCGGEAETICIDSGSVCGDEWRVQCHDCGSKSGTYGYIEHAIEAWNTRDEMTCTDVSYIALIDGFLCSECDCCLTAEQFYFGELNYCPNCGAKVVSHE